MPEVLPPAPAVRSEPLDDEIAEEWVRQLSVGRDTDVRGLGAHRIVDTAEAAWPWTVSVSVAEFIRQEPLESQMCAAIETALRSVPGVTDVAHEDREVWILCGSPSGAALVNAVGIALDALHPQLAAAYDAL